MIHYNLILQFIKTIRAYKNDINRGDKINE